MDAKTDGSPAPPSDHYDKAKTQPKKSGRRWVPLIVAGVAIIVILALALGLGLGLGLKKHHNQSSTTPVPSNGNSNGTSSEDSNASKEVQSWRRSTEDYSLDMDTWNLNAPPTIRSYNLTVSEMSLAPDGVNRTVLAINGQYPGPLIRMNRGDRLLVSLTNNLPNATTLHWHGLFQNGTNWMDGTTGVTQCPVPPGANFLYNFTVDGQFGTYWYHAHFSTQYTDGIVGPLIIHAPEEAQTRSQYDFDQVILVQDWYHDLSSSLLPQYLGSDNENAEPVPDNGLIQGENYFNCSSYPPDSGYDCADNSSRPVFAFEQNKRYRLRFINTGAFTPFQISVDNHTLEVIEADGTIVSPFSVHRFEIAVAQRYSVILHANQTSSTNYWMRAQMITECFAADNDVLDPDIRALVTYTNSTGAPTASGDWADAQDLICKDLNSTLLIPANHQQAPLADVLYELAFSFNIGAYAMDRAIVNGTSWSPSTNNPTLNQAVSGLRASNASFTTTGVISPAFSENQFVISVPEVQVVDILILNFDDGSHPFHLHGHVFWVMLVSNDQYFDWDSNFYSENLNTTAATQYTKNPIRRDTITIPAYGHALLRFKSDNPGMWALHCHNIWHMEAGLLTQIMARRDVMKTWEIPADVQGLCSIK